MMNSKLPTLTCMVLIFLTVRTEGEGITPCVSSCADKPNGDYQSCEGCSVYVTCSNQLIYDNRPCPAGLVWDDGKKRCEWTSDTCTEDTNEDITTCVSSCADKPNGDYQSCEGCSVYVTCSNQLTFDNRPCPAGLVWDDGKKRCDWTSDTCTEDTNVDEVCDEVVCSSWNFAYNECPSSKSYITAKVSKKVSKSDCKLGTSYGLNETGMWVDKGCRGLFKVCQCSKSSVIDCDSWKFKYADCPIDSPSLVYSVKVADKRSVSDCELDTSFGINDQGMWVDKGCRASFDVCSCSSTKVVNCDSWQFKYAECEVEAPNGILKIEVADKRSHSDCVLGDSYGINEKGIWVDKGCRAAFDICLN